MKILEKLSPSTKRIKSTKGDKRIHLAITNIEVKIY